MKRLSTLAAVTSTILSAAAVNAEGTYHRVALLMGAQEVPPVATQASGAGVFRIDTCANTVAYYITYSCLSATETAAHIHGAANPGVNAGVVFPLPTGNVKTGVWNYPEALEADLLEGRLYVNVHSATSPGGEIRGQIVSAVAILDGAQEVPPAPGTGAGFGLFNIDLVNNQMDYYIAISSPLGAPETAAHIHGIARHGVNAGVLHPLPAGSPKVGTWNFTAAQAPAIMDGLTYVNIHTTAFPGGEIRGQVTPIVLPIDSRQEVPPNASTGAGHALLSLDRATDNLGFDIRSCGLSANETAAHFHGFAPRGVNAGVLSALPAGPRKLGTWAYGPANEPGLLDGRVYINIHTTSNPGGEIRGQVEFPRPACIGDIDCDRDVDLGDLARLLAGFGGPGNKDDGDVNGDGVVDLGDLSLLLSAFGSTCP